MAAADKPYVYDRLVENAIYTVLGILRMYIEGDLVIEDNIELQDDLDTVITEAYAFTQRTKRKQDRP
jgi:hypothetical protein